MLNVPAVTSQLISLVEYFLFHDFFKIFFLHKETDVAINCAINLLNKLI